MTPIKCVYTVFPRIRPAGIIISHSLQMRVLLENTTSSLQKIIRNAGLLELQGLFEGGSYMRKYNNPHKIPKILCH